LLLVIKTHISIIPLIRRSIQLYSDSQTA